jgi:hypothetical protein
LGLDVRGGAHHAKKVHMHKVMMSTGKPTAKKQKTALGKLQSLIKLNSHVATGRRLIWPLVFR